MVEVTGLVSGTKERNVAPQQETFLDISNWSVRLE